MIPEAKPESIDNAKPGLATISLKIVSPAETDVYTFRKNNLPTKNNENMAIINPTDHLPNLVFGRSLIFFINFIACTAFDAGAKIAWFIFLFLLKTIFF